ncbi:MULTISPECIES: hypothetical protein [unclassified Bradyrhizobium]|uniref:hypothetical protein n=1 Tax=unclassified Bradyrhizobium TaxID=2631580 RepID=UPI001BAD808F|nr:MULTISPECIES: hypothetical protein [unclassified Bradyrhizobium]MBR1227475.1 hypothetical protein [Bradyrhizobium sp. AUGA SZCCT0176]MBR1295793.1 hypothetical protein [Bradyrhizobium sp. AUGA SZCCT0042]
MTGPRTLVAAALMSIVLATSTLAQEPAAYAAQNPDRDVLNGGVLTPAGRLAREQPGDAAAALYALNKANAGLGSAAPSTGVQRHRRRSLQ